MTPNYKAYNDNSFGKFLSHFCWELLIVSIHLEAFLYETLKLAECLPKKLAFLCIYRVIPMENALTLSPNSLQFREGELVCELF